MPKLPLQSQPASLTDLTECPEFGTPIGPKPYQSSKIFYEGDGVIMGTWECEPGEMKLEIAFTEFCHLLKGHWVMTSDTGEVTEVRQGDSFAFPKGWKGTARVLKTVRKAFTLITG